MGKQRTRPHNAGNAGATSIAEAEITFADSIQDVVDVPAGAVVIRVWAQILEAFNAATTNIVIVGHAADDDAYLVAADITEGAPGVYPAAGKGPFAAETAARTIQAKFTQSGTAATAGIARVFVEYARLAANG